MLECELVGGGEKSSKLFSNDFSRIHVDELPLLVVYIIVLFVMLCSVLQLLESGYYLLGRVPAKELTLLVMRHRVSHCTWYIRRTPPNNCNAYRIVQDIFLHYCADVNLELTIHYKSALKPLLSEKLSPSFVFPQSCKSSVLFMSTRKVFNHGWEEVLWSN